MQLSPKQFQRLEKVYKLKNLGALERSFGNNFFEFTRDGSWMEDAVGSSAKWLEIPGIVPWHVRAAIETLGYQDTSGTSNEYCFFGGIVTNLTSEDAQEAEASGSGSQAPYDPVRASARENQVS